MQKTIEQIIYSVIEQYSSYRVNDDNDLDPEFVRDKILDVRNALVEQQFKQKKVIDIEFLTRCECVDILCEDLMCDGISSGETRRYIDASNLNLSYGKSSLVYVGPLTFDPQSDWRIFFNPYGIGGRDTRGKQVCGRVIGDKIVIENLPSETEKCAMLVLTKNGFCSQVCNDALPLRIPAHLIATLEQLVLKALLPPQVYSQKDNKNDAAPGQLENKQ